MDMGLCQKASSLRASHLHLAKKDDSTWRPSGDYCCLNMTIEPDHNPLPIIVGVTSNLNGAWIFSKLDYWMAIAKSPLTSKISQKQPSSCNCTPPCTWTKNFKGGLRQQPDYWCRPPLLLSHQQIQVSISPIKMQRLVFWSVSVPADLFTQPTCGRGTNQRMPELASSQQTVVPLQPRVPKPYTLYFQDAVSPGSSFSSMQRCPC